MKRHFRISRRRISRSRNLRRHVKVAAHLLMTIFIVMMLGIGTIIPLVFILPYKILESIWAAHHPDGPTMPPKESKLWGIKIISLTKVPAGVRRIKLAAKGRRPSGCTESVLSCEYKKKPDVWRHPASSSSRTEVRKDL